MDRAEEFIQLFKDDLQTFETLLFVTRDTRRI